MIKIFTLKSLKWMICSVVAVLLCIGMLSNIRWTPALAQESATATNQTNSKAQQSSESAVQATQLFRKARLTYSSRTVVATQISEEVLIHGRRIVGSGTYKEKIDDSKRFLRMDMNYSSDDSQYSIQYIADGSKDLFWIVKNMEEQEEILQVNLFKLTEQTANPDLVASIDNVPITPISLGGIPYLLFQLERYYLFDGYAVDTNTQTGEKCYIIEGHWNPKQFPLQQFVSKEGTIAWDSVPTELPDTVKIYFNAQTLFPYRIHYYRTINGKSSLITKIHYYNVSFDVRLTQKQFNFDYPTDAFRIDVTEFYMKSSALSQEK